ncbi:MAG TPA: alpha/beta fold hydrolase [Ramlibacter sp.]|nr:alpha/beta fold hydrolase [Ramlibacter sp.]
MTPRQDIRFCTAPDGVKLAMALYGSGPPLVRAATWFTHIERDPTSLLNRPWIEALSANHTYVTYDMRGTGLSSRRVDNLSLDAWVSDLATVIDAIGAERVPVLGISQGAAIAVAYAARHPERVSALILLGGFASAYFSGHHADPKVREEGEMLIKLVRMGWGSGAPAYRRVFVSKFLPGASHEMQDEFDEYSNLSCDPETAARALEAQYHFNVREEAKRVSCPALVMHVQGDQVVYFDQGRRLASLIPGARFVPLPGNNHVPLETDPCWPHAIQEIRAFLGTQGETPRLTARQQQVLRLVADGRTDKQIARQLSLSPRTVEMHVAGALKALGCASRAEAVRKAAEGGLLR